MPKDASKSAQLYRMVMQDHLCPYGLKSKDLLEREGYEVEDHHLTTREETDAFMEKHGVETTPQTWIGDKRIGGYDDLRVHFGLDAPESERSDTSYRPVIAIFAVAFLMALGLSWYSFGTILSLRALGALRQDLSLRRGFRRYPHGRRGADLAFGTRSTLYRNGRCGIGLQGGLHRQARAEMRLRRR